MSFGTSRVRMKSRVDGRVVDILTDDDTSESTCDFYFAVSGGKSGGHAIPAILVCRKIRELIPEARIIYIGAKGSLEERLAGEEGYSFHPVWISFLERGSMISNLLLPLKCVVALLQAIIYLTRYKTKFVIGTGGFSAWPACTAARLIGKPYFLLEQNVYPGLVTRLSAQGAKKIYLGYSEASRYLKVRGERLLHTGNPIHTGIGMGNREEARQTLGLNNANITLLVTGGSGGAESINRTIFEIKDKLLDNGFNLIWQTGRNWDGNLDVPSAQSDRVIMKRFFNLEEMVLAYDASDLAVARCGAMTLAELAAAGLPALLIPYPYAAGGHQEANSRAVEAAGAAKVILNEELNSDTLFGAIQDISGSERRNEMSRAMKGLARTDAAARIVADIIEVVRRN